MGVPGQADVNAVEQMVVNHVDLAFKGLPHSRATQVNNGAFGALCLHSFLQSASGGSAAGSHQVVAAAMAGARLGEG